MASASPGPAIGIDLGTTFSCVAVLTDQKVEVIENRHGKRTMPSYVSFTGNERWVGERAKTRALMDPENTINNVKRLIGRTLADENVKRDIQSFPFKVINDGNGNPTIQVKFEGKDKLFRPEQISAMVLGELKTLAEEFLGKPVKDAVITVPAYFTDAQRQATKDAGIIAGLNVLGTINEPTAAALAYGFDTCEKLEKSTVIVYDFGGGTFDVSVLDIVNGKVDVLSSGGDGHLGGEDIDDLLVRHMNSEFLKKNSIDLFERASSSNVVEARNAKKALRRLRFACEKLKIDLTYNRNSKIDLDLLFDEKSLYAKVSRVFFEGLCEDLLRKTISKVLETLEAANSTPEDISEIILVGGTTRIPMVTKMLKEVFPNKDLCENINADEAVAYGAAIQAAILSGMDPLQIKNVRFRDVTPMSLGIETFGGIMATVIKRNTTVPVQKTKVFTTSRDNQTQICIKVFEGERHMTKYNNLLGEFTLVGIPPAPRRIPQVEVIFEVDANGILRVKATDLGTEWVSDIQVTNKRGRLSPEEIERAVREAERMREQDNKERLKVRARVRLEIYANQIQKSLTNPVIRDKLDPEQFEKLSAIVNESLKLYESYQNPGEAEFEKKYNELDKLWLSEVIKCYPGYNHGSPDAPSVLTENLFSLSGFEMLDDFSENNAHLHTS